MENLPFYTPFPLPSLFLPHSTLFSLFLFRLHMICRNNERSVVDYHFVQPASVGNRS